jgi:hypothetical protein
MKSICSVTKYRTLSWGYFNNALTPLRYRVIKESTHSFSLSIRQLSYVCILLPCGALGCGTSKLQVLRRMKSKDMGGAIIRCDSQSM